MTETQEIQTRSPRRRLEALARPLVDAKGTVGLAIGVFHRGETQTYCAGTTVAKDAQTPTERTLFEIGSITKVLTTTLLADMHLRGEVDLDDPASKYLPPTTVLHTRDGIQITLRHLATHRSGLPRIPSNMGFTRLWGENPYAHYSVEDLYAFLSKRRIISTPGAFFHYSNLGMGLLGHILALAAGQDFETLVIQRICRPLGMNETAITLSDPLRDRLAPGHSMGEQVSNWDIPTLAGCGAFRSTLADMLLFLKGNMHSEETPLQRAFELAQTIQSDEIKGRRRIPWHALKPGPFGLSIHAGLGVLAGYLFTEGRPGMSLFIVFLMATIMAAKLLLSFLPMPETGLGWFIDPLGSDESEGRIFWHNGGTGGYRSYLGFTETRDLGVVILSNSTQSPDALGKRLLNEWFPSSVLGEPPDQRPGRAEPQACPEE